MDYPQRKDNRIKYYDYSRPGAYFVTVCTKDRAKLFWEHVGASIARPEDVRLSEAGKVVQYAIENISLRYPALSVDNYTIMPNHIHLLLQIHTDDHGQRMPAPSISVVVQQMKGYVTKKLGCSVWQKLFHDHVVRGQKDYEMIWEYIRDNPVKWTEDCFFVP